MSNESDQEMSLEELDEFLNESFEREFGNNGDNNADSENPQNDKMSNESDNVGDIDQEMLLESGNNDHQQGDDSDNADGENPHVELRESNSAFNRRIREFELINFGYKDIERFLLKAFEQYQSKIIEAVNQYRIIKTLSYFNADFERAFVTNELNENPTVEKRTIYIPTTVKEISKTTDLSKHFQRDIVDHIMGKVEETMVEGSGFTLSKINKLIVQIYKYESLRGASFIKLPKDLEKKRSIINLKNIKDNECFKWAILSALHYNDVYNRNKNRVNEVERYAIWKNELNFDGIDFPVRLNQIDKFMQQNDGIAVNVYHYDSEKKRVCPLFLAMKPINYRFIHLLYLTKPKEREEYSDDNIDYENPEASRDSHYCWIKNLNALVRPQTTKNTRKLFLCDRCLNHFSSKEKLEQHVKTCSNMNDYAIEMPTNENNYESFRNYKNGLKIPFIIYADCEALLKEPDTPVFSTNCNTKAHQQHEVHSIGYYFKNGNEEGKSRYVSHRGENCIDLFMNDLTNIATEVFDFLECKRPMNALTDEEEKEFSEATVCHICKRSFSLFINDNKDEIRVKDHCHISGQYRGAAHQKCNLEYQISRKIPIVMHNLSGYDLHLLIRKLSNIERIPGEVVIIPNNSEKYISFIKTMRAVGSQSKEGKYTRHIKFQFIDSLRFMSASLDYLASALPHEKKHILKTECAKLGYTDDMFNLLVRKGVFPYEYIDCYEKLEESALPPKNSFYSTLTQTDVTDNDYEHAHQVWNSFGIQSLGEYSDLYLKTDVLLLADVFENFRNTCYAAYSLDPAHYMSAPGLSFDAMLKYTGVSIELFTDVDMLMFIERAIRGGISQINTRYAKANNMYMGAEFDDSKDTSYLMYLDGEYTCFIFLL